jgi:hypothetical protein
MLDDNYGLYASQQLSDNVSNQYTITTTDNTASNNYGQLTISDPLHRHQIDLNGRWQESATYGPNYKEIFEKLITYILGSSKVSQDIKDEFINQGVRLKEFRNYVKEYFPQYIDKITLWEKLHPEEK